MFVINLSSACGPWYNFWYMCCSWFVVPVLSPRLPYYPHVIIKKFLLSLIYYISMVPDVVHDVAPNICCPQFFISRTTYIVEYIRTTWILQIGDNTGTNKFGTTHIRNYFVDHIDMKNWGQHILESTSGTTHIWQTGGNTYWGLYTGLHWKPYRYDKLRRTHIRGYIRDTILDHANITYGG